MSIPKTTFTALLVTATMVPCAWAQGSQPLPDVALSAYVARDVRVSDAGGKTLAGAIASIHDEQVEVLTRGGVETIPLDDIVRIERRGDSLRDGFITGAVIGGVLGLLACAECEVGAGFRIYAMAVSGALYGFVGAGIDAMHDGWTPLYVRKEKGRQAMRGTPAALVSLRLRF